MERKSQATSKPSAAELPKDLQECTTSVDINQDPRYGTTNTPDWLITFLSKQGELEYKSKQLEQERERTRDERHELLMRLLCETLDRCVRNNSPPHECSNGANNESNESQTQRTETNVQHTSTSPQAKTKQTKCYPGQDHTRRTQARGRRASRPILHCLTRDCQQRRSLPA